MNKTIGTGRQLSQLSAACFWTLGEQLDASARFVRDNPPCMADFKKLLVWQKAHSLALNVNRVAGQIRGATHVSLRSQMVRAAMSIDANIVEGRGQKSERDFARFLGYAVNSANELESHLIMARDVGAMNHCDFLTLLGQLVEVRKMLHGLLNKIGTASIPIKHAAGS